MLIIKEEIFDEEKAKLQEKLEIEAEGIGEATPEELEKEAKAND